jgi:spore maturation protein CgeB
MKIISILPEHDPNTKLNYRINIGFINKLNTLCDYRGIQAYSKNNILHSAEELYSKYKPDAILLLAHSDILNGYLKDIPCLKVMIAVDYRKIERDNKFYWYKNNQFDLVIQRGAYNITSFQKHIGIPSVWVPYSADNKEFYPIKERINKIGFTGTTSNNSYAQRRKALQLLEKENLINNTGKLNGEGYSSFLRIHRAMLTDTQTKDGRRSPHAKMFEILASGSVCLTPDFDYNFLPNDCYVKYKDDCSDIIEKAKWIMNNKEETDIIANKGYNEFLKYHTDTIRIKEVYQHINQMLEGKSLIKKWGI